MKSKQELLIETMTALICAEISSQESEKWAYDYINDQKIEGFKQLANKIIASAS